MQRSAPRRRDIKVTCASPGSRRRKYATQWHSSGCCEQNGTQANSEVIVNQNDSRAAYRQSPRTLNYINGDPSRHRLHASGSVYVAFGLGGDADQILNEELAATASQPRIVNKRLGELISDLNAIVRGCANVCTPPLVGSS